MTGIVGEICSSLDRRQLPEREERSGTCRGGFRTGFYLSPLSPNLLSSVIVAMHRYPPMAEGRLTNRSSGIMDTGGA